MRLLCYLLLTYGPLLNPVSICVSPSVPHRFVLARAHCGCAPHFHVADISASAALLPTPIQYTVKRFDTLCFSDSFIITQPEKSRHYCYSRRACLTPAHLRRLALGYVITSGSKQHAPGNTSTTWSVCPCFVFQAVDREAGAPLVRFAIRLLPWLGPY
jgi:hypothetical protein